MIRVLQSFWRPSTGIFLALWLVLMVGGRSRFLQDPGTFWHTVVGEQMLTTGRLIYTDTFSFTFAGQRWSPHQWLGECVMALLHRLDGLDTLLLASVTILAALYTWLACRLMRAGLHWSVAAIMVALTVAASSSHFHIRPHLATIVGMGCTMAFLLDFEVGRISASRMFWLVPIYWLWSNLHGGMLGGLGTMGFALAGWTLARMLRLPTPIERYRQILPLVGLMVACGLTALINPYGTRLPQIWMEIMDSPVLPHIVQEHAPLSIHKPDGLMVLFFAGAYLFMLAGVLPSWPRVSWLLPLIWLYLGCSRVRHAPLFAITASLAIADIFPHTRWAQYLVRSGSDWFRPPEPIPAPRGMSLRPALVPCLVLVLAVWLQSRHISVPVLGHGWARLDPNYWPVEVTPALAAHQDASRKATPIFNEYLFGGYLIYFTPGYRVLVDDRCELYGDRWLKDYVDAEVEDTAARIHSWEQQYSRFDLALTRTASGYDRYFANSAEWASIERTPTATLYERKATRQASVATSASQANAQRP
jgi:hypothetical protein